MTTREVATFLGELGAIRELIGQISERLTALEKSVQCCQNRCSDERQRRATWIHWTGAVFAALIPGGVLFVLNWRYFR